jgi:hypothetical protein
MPRAPSKPAQQRVERFLEVVKGTRDEEEVDTVPFFKVVGEADPSLALLPCKGDTCIALGLQVADRPNKLLGKLQVTIIAVEKIAGRPAEIEYAAQAGRNWRQLK